MKRAGSSDFSVQFRRPLFMSWAPFVFAGGLGILSDKCHEYRSIDLSWLRRNKLLNVGRRSTLTWSRSGQVTGSIRIECLPRGLVEIN